jgi:hypothetical protein
MYLFDWNSIFFIHVFFYITNIIFFKYRLIMIWNSSFNKTNVEFLLYCMKKIKE